MHDNKVILKKKTYIRRIILIIIAVITINDKKFRIYTTNV